MTDSTRACERGVLSANDTAVSEKVKSIEKTGFVLYIYIFFFAALYIAQYRTIGAVWERSGARIQNWVFLAHAGAAGLRNKHTHTTPHYHNKIFSFDTLPIHVYIHIDLSPFFPPNDANPKTSPTSSSSRYFFATALVRMYTLYSKKKERTGQP